MLTWFVCLYLAVFLAAILILWVGYEIIRKRRANTSTRHQVFCRICESRYTETSPADLLTCPTCGSLNERAAKKGF